MGKIERHRRTREGLGPATKTPVADGKSRRTWRAWPLLAIWGLVLLAYSNSFQSGLVFDNSSIIGQDPRIREATAHNMAAILHGGYRYTRPTDGLYRPMTTFTYLLNYAVLGNGANPAGYHWVNLAVHEINVALVYALGIAILGDGVAAWALAAIWGVHPVLTESVTNIVGRADLLAAFGVLAGLLCHVKGASAAGRRRWAWLAGLVACQAAGLFSKENAAVLPGLMLLYDLTRFDRTPWRRRAPGYAALALPFAAFFYLRVGVPTHMQISVADNPLVNAGFGIARLTAINVMGQLIWLFLWPARLSADYSYNAVPLFQWRSFNWQDAKALLALAFCLSAALAVLLRAMRRRRADSPILFFLAFFFIAALPTSNLIVQIGSIMAERFLYLPSVGLAGFVLAAALALGRRLPLRQPTAAQVAWAAFGIACLALAGRSYARNFDWKDELSLWTATVEVSPESAKAHYNLAKTLEGLPGRLPEAIAEYQTALRIDPADTQAHTNLGNALASIPGRLPEAIAEYRTAVGIEPNRAEPHNDLGNALAAMPARLPEAIAEYRTALRLQPENAEVHYNLANALIHAPGALAEAIAEYREALRIDPNHADAHLNLANVLAGLSGRLPEAIAEYRTALRINPDLVRAHLNLGNALSGAGRLPEAAAEYQAALRSQPENAEAHYDLGTVLERFPGRLLDAISEYQAALRSAPNLFEAHVNLGNALAQTPGRRRAAIAEYEAALRIRPDPVVRQMMDQLRAEN